MILSELPELIDIMINTTKELDTCILSDCETMDGHHDIRRRKCKAYQEKMKFTVRNSHFEAPTIFGELARRRFNSPT
jgi:hypothetical protein